MWMVPISIWTFHVCIKLNTDSLRFPRSRDLPAAADKYWCIFEPIIVTDQLSLAGWTKTVDRNHFCPKLSLGYSNLEASLALWLWLWLIPGGKYFSWGRWPLHHWLPRISGLLWREFIAYWKKKSSQRHFGKEKTRKWAPWLCHQSLDSINLQELRKALFFFKPDVYF